MNTVPLPITKNRQVSSIYKETKLPAGNERILLVDDEVPIVQLLSKILKRLGYHVTARTSSLEALDLFSSKPTSFDLCITDMTMPRMDGDRLALEMMKIRPDIPVILCSGYSRRVSDDMSSKLGIKAFAYKPIVQAELASIVRMVLDQAKETIQR